MHSRCINCNIILGNLQNYEVKTVSQSLQTKLVKWLSTQLPPNAHVCRPCYLLLHVKSDKKRVLGHTNVCRGCGLVTKSLETVAVNNDDPILLNFHNWIKPQQELTKNIVCADCWKIYKIQNDETITLMQENPINILKIENPDEELNSDDPFLPGDIQYLDETEDLVFPEEQPSDTIHKNPTKNPMKPAKRPQLNSSATAPSQPPSKIFKSNPNEMIVLPNYMRIISTDKCIFSKCENEPKLQVPNFAKRIMLCDYNYYIPGECKLCEAHSKSNDWEFLLEEKAESTFSADHIEDLFSILVFTGDYNQDSDDDFTWD